MRRSHKAETYQTLTMTHKTLINIPAAYNGTEKTNFKEQVLLFFINAP
jgi:hypothetical protein